NAACEELLAATAAGENAVCGAVLNQDGGRRRIRARRGVLLASGGFERNREMRQQYDVPGSVTDTMGAAGKSGSAIRAAIEVGAGNHASGREFDVLVVVHRRTVRRQPRRTFRERVVAIRPDRANRVVPRCGR